MPATQVPHGPPPVVPGHRVGDLLGAGAAGTVWEAVRESDGVALAVKVVPVGADGPEAGLAARELGVLAGVDVEGLVGFHGAVGLPGEPPRVAILLDRVEGGSLQRAVSARGHLSVGESVTVLAPVARALAGLHAAGVVHGDVSPGNVLLERSGRPLLADLGVARLAGEVPGAVFGTPGFVAPEVEQGAAPSPASDVYAVGALAWWCLTGAAPGPAALRRPLDELAPGLPKAWREATLAALRGDPKERPSAADLALAFFDSAQCEALQLVVGTDETSLLTARLRRAGEPVPQPAPPVPRRGRRAALRPHRLRMPSLRPPRLRVPRRGRALVATVAAVVAAASLFAAVVAPLFHLPHADRARGDVAPATATPAALVTDHGSAGRDPVGLMQEVSDLRARAMNTSSPTDLARLDAPGSPALAQDTATLHRLQASGRRYEGVRLHVRGATVQWLTRDRAHLRAVVDTAAYRVVSSSGTAQPRPATAGDPMRFTLRWDGDRWQVERVDAA
ncbi:MAG TPA: serine/threonine-protein kinase [Pedococcus sp.]